MTASATLHAMLWPRMPAGERIAAWVTWNLFFLAQLPDKRRRVSLHVLPANFFQSFHQTVHYGSIVPNVQSLDGDRGQQISRR